MISKSYNPVFFHSSVYSGFKSIEYLGGTRFDPQPALTAVQSVLCCLMPSEMSLFFSEALRRRNYVPKPEKVLTVFMQRCHMSNVLGEADGSSFISAVFHLLKQQRIWPKGRSAISCRIDFCSKTTEKFFYLLCIIITVHQKAKKALNYTWLVTGVWYFNVTFSIVASFFVSSLHFKPCHLGQSTAKQGYLSVCWRNSTRLILLPHPSKTYPAEHIGQTDSFSYLP